MKIELDKTNLIELNTDLDEKLNLIFKTMKDKNTIMVLNAKLNKKQLDELISALMSFKLKVK